MSSSRHAAPLNRRFGFGESSFPVDFPVLRVVTFGVAVPTPDALEACALVLVVTVLAVVVLAVVGVPPGRYGLGVVVVVVVDAAVVIGMVRVLESVVVVIGNPFEVE